MAHDRELVACEEEHEIEYILKKFGKRTTKENIAILQEHCRYFKGLPDHGPHNRKNFYRYLDLTDILLELE